MKKEMRKFVSIWMCLVLLLSILPAAATAADCEHIFVLVEGTEQLLFEPHDDTCHLRITRAYYTCANCGESRWMDVATYQEHLAPAGSGVLLGSYMDENGVLVYNYRYTCNACGASYYKDEYR